MKRLLFILLFFPAVVFAPEPEYFAIPDSGGMRDERLLNWQNIKSEIAKYDIHCPELLLLQIRLETANLTSHLCRDHNNLTGMKKAVKRKTTAIGREKNGTAVYRTWQDSIKDYYLWQNEYYKGGDYMKFLHERYATDIYYASKLKRLNII